MNQCMVAMGGRLFLVGKTKLYLVARHTAVSRDVNPWMDFRFQKE